MSDSFGIMLACVAFMLGLGVGLFLATTRTTPLPRGKPVSDRRLRTMHVIDPMLDGLERQHPTIYPRKEPR